VNRSSDITGSEVTGNDVTGNDFIGSDVTGRVRDIISRAFFFTGIFPCFSFGDTSGSTRNFWEFPIGHFVRCFSTISANANLGNSKSQVHCISFIDKTMHKSLDHGYSRVSQCSRNIAHGFSGTSVYHIKYTVVSAYSGAFVLKSDGVVNPTRTMFVHKVHVSTYKGWSSSGIVIFSSRIGIDA